MSAEGGRISEDALLDGKLVLRQPVRGHRFGHDAVLLAAAAAARPGEHAIELGAGVGAAGLTLARRVEGLTVTLVEIDPALTELARENAARNALAERVRAVCLDVGALAAEFTAAGLCGRLGRSCLDESAVQYATKSIARSRPATGADCLGQDACAMAARRGVAPAAARHEHADLARGWVT